MAVEAVEMQREISVLGLEFRMVQVWVNQAQAELSVLGLGGRNDHPSLWISVAALLFLNLFAEVHDVVVRRVRRSVSLQHLHIYLLLAIVIPLFFHPLLCSFCEPRLLR